MGNWKITPKNLDGKVVACTPKWTSGSGCYRVKRFSLCFPLFMVGSPKVIKNCIQLIRWSSKLPYAKDVAVLLQNNGRLVHLFNGQSFLVHYFTEMWKSSALSNRFVFVEKSNLKYYEHDLRVDDETRDDIFQQFVDASIGLTQKQLRQNRANAQAAFDNCQNVRTNHPKQLDSVYPAASIVARTEEILPTVIIQEPAIIDIQKIAEHFSKTGEFQTDKMQRKANKIKEVKAINLERSKLRLSEIEIDDLNSIKKTCRDELKPVFTKKSLITKKRFQGYECVVREFGPNVLLSMKPVNGKKLEYFPFKDSRAALKFINVFRQHLDRPLKKLCFRAANGLSGFNEAVIGHAPDAALDYFQDHWSGTPVSYSSFITYNDPIESSGVLPLIKEVCEKAHVTAITACQRYSHYF